MAESVNGMILRSLGREPRPASNGGQPNEQPAQRQGFDGGVRGRETVKGLSYVHSETSSDLLVRALRARRQKTIEAGPPEVVPAGIGPDW